MRPERRIRRLRKFLSSHPDLQQFGTQRGFGEMIGRSETYIRALETKCPMSKKVACEIQRRTDVDYKWLLGSDEDETGSAAETGLSQEIPSVSGEPLTHEMVIRKARAESERATIAGARQVAGTSLPDVGQSRYARVVEGLLAAWRDKLISELVAGDRRNFDDLMTKLGEEK